MHGLCFEILYSSTIPTIIITILFFLYLQILRESHLYNLPEEDEDAHGKDVNKTKLGKGTGTDNESEDIERDIFDSVRPGTPQTPQSLKSQNKRKTSPVPVISNTSGAGMNSIPDVGFSGRTQTNAGEVIDLRGISPDYSRYLPQNTEPPQRPGEEFEGNATYGHILPSHGMKYSND